MILRKHWLFAVVLIAGFPGAAKAQAERYDLGRRLGAFELAWEANTDQLARKRALAVLQPAALTILTMQFNEAGRIYDEARHALAGAKEVSPATLWADALVVRPATRLLDVSETELPLTVQAFYQPKAPAPKDARLGLAIFGAKAFQVPLTKVPMDGKMPLVGMREGDHLIHVTIKDGDKLAAQTMMKISLVKDLRPRLEKLKQDVASFGPKIGSTDIETVREIHAALAALANKEVKEIDYPAARLINEVEAAVEAIKAGKRFYGGDKTGQFWLRLPNSISSVAVRLQAPDAVKEKKPLPLVVAMHGLGGSENLFFESYGSGITAKLCKERNWLMVAPRGGLLNAYSPVQVVDEIAKLYPVDLSKVFIVSHSIGVHQALATVQQSPTRFAVVAALASGGIVKPKSDIRGVGFFVGVGTNDLSMLTARSLTDKLKKAGAKFVQHLEYQDFEHMVVVREAMPDVFAMFDTLAKEK